MSAIIFRNNQNGYTMNKRVLHSVIDQISESSRERIAIEEVADSISYGSLTSYSNRIANNLLKGKVMKGTVVGVYLESGINYVASILGINKAGAIFMPLELTYPIKRTDYILEKVRPSVIITEEKHTKNIIKIYSGSSDQLGLEKLILVS